MGPPRCARSGAGDDDITLDGGGEIDLGPGDDTALVVRGTIDGGAGDDVLRVILSGTANGGPGRDILSGSVNAEDYGMPSEGDRFALNGDDGRDLIYQPSGFMQGGYKCPTICGHADIDGGSARDTLSLWERGVVDLRRGGLGLRVAVQPELDRERRSKSSPTTSSAATRPPTVSPAGVATTS